MWNALSGERQKRPQGGQYTGGRNGPAGSTPSAGKPTPSLEVDTTDGYDPSLDEIVAFLAG